MLQTGPRLMVSDLFDFSIYVDARIEDIEAWYIKRFSGAAEDVVRGSERPLPSLRGPVRRTCDARGRGHLELDQPAEPGREHPPDPPRATLVLRKDADHTINRLRLRKL